MIPWLKPMRASTPPTLQKLETALRAITDDRAQTDVISSGFVSHFSILEREGRLRAVITLDFPDGRTDRNEALAALVEKAARLPGIDDIRLITSAHRPATNRDGRLDQTEGPAQRPQSHGKQNPKKGRAAPQKIALPAVRHILSVASGKGGVGKSTIAANLAIALARAGHRVGMMDADIYGPSLPVLFGLTQRAEIREKRIQPIEKYNLRLMSIGLLLDEAKALAWRGPMVMGAVRQLLGDVDWGELDYLIIDTPPGTGDAHLTLLQTLHLSGAVIVTTPQKMALADVRRGIELLEKMSVPILGLIENMAWFDTEAGERLALYGPSRGARIAEIENIPFLRALPVLPALSEACDQGVPLAISAAQETAPPEPKASISQPCAAKNQMVEDFDHIARMIAKNLLKQGRNSR